MTEYELNALMHIIDEMEASAEALQRESTRSPVHSRYLAGVSSGFTAAADMLSGALKKLDTDRSKRVSMEALESMYQYYNMVTMEDEFRD
jgi:hypothetical protein